MSQLVTTGPVTVADPFGAGEPVAPVPVSPSLALVRTGPVPVPVARRRTDRGLVSAEWAMAIIAAVAIVGVLVAVISSGVVKGLLLKVIKAIIAGALTHI